MDRPFRDVEAALETQELKYMCLARHESRSGSSVGVTQQHMLTTHLYIPQLDVLSEAEQGSAIP